MKKYFKGGICFMDMKVIKIIGFVSTIILSLVTSWVNEKQLNNTIDKKVAEAMTNKEE